jgi:hypothetical protein
MDHAPPGAARPDVQAAIVPAAGGVLTGSGSALAWIDDTL